MTLTIYKYIRRSLLFLVWCIQNVSSTNGIEQLWNINLDIYENDIPDSWDILSNIPIRNNTNYSEPVLFEPIRQIKLNRANFKVISFVNFKPYIQTSNQVRSYLNALKINFEDMLIAAEPQSWGNQRSDMPNHSDPASNDQDHIHYISWQHLDMVPNSDNKTYGLLLELYEEALFLEELYEAIEEKFMSALDHLKMHPSSSSSNEEIAYSRQKRSVLGGLAEIFTSMFGFGDSDSSYDQATLDKIKQNLAILQQDINEQQEEITGNRLYINLTRVEVGINRKALHQLDLKLIRLNQTLASKLHTLQQAQHRTLTLISAQHRLNIVRNGLARLQFDIREIYDYLTSIATHMITPRQIPPDDLRVVLEQVSIDMHKFSQRIKLPFDPKKDIWNYYKILRIYPIVLEDYLVIMIDIPLVDKSRELNIYKAHNLPILHPLLKKTFQYQLESEYFGITSDVSHVTLLKEVEIIKCIIIGQHFCNLESPLYPLEKADWCVVSLFINDPRKIDESCSINILNQTMSYAINLHNNLWAVSVMAPEKLRISCISKTEIYYVELHPPFKIIEIPNSCEAYSPVLLIPAYTETSATRQNITISQRFLGFHKTYLNITDFRLINESPLARMSKEQLESLSIKLPALQDIPLPILREKLQQIDESYPYSMPIWLVILITIITTIIIVLISITILYFCKRKQQPPVSLAVPVDKITTQTALLTPSTHDNETDHKDPESTLSHSEIKHTTDSVSEQATNSAGQETEVKSVPVRATPETVKFALQSVGFDFKKFDKKVRSLDNPSPLLEDTSV